MKINNGFILTGALRAAIASAIMALTLAHAPAARAEMKYQITSRRATVTTQWYSFEYDFAAGTWDVRWPDGKPFISKAYSSWRVAGPDGGRATETVSYGAIKPARSLKPFMDPWGKGRALAVSFRKISPNIEFSASFRFYEDLPYFTVRCGMRNDGETPLRAADFTPFKSGADNGGGMFVGADPAAAWILEDGYNTYFDFNVRLITGAELSNSNWNSAFYDPATGRAAVLGFITVDRAMVNVLSHYQPADAAADPASGWKPFSGVRAVSDFNPSKRVAPGGSLDSETLLIMPDMSSPHRALETFASAAAARYPRKSASLPPPTGWNSWATALHTAITQDNMMENARAAKSLFLNFGMDTFQVDDGWQQQHGDWEPNDKFPGGMKKLFDGIAALGFRPGMWIMPFCVSSESKFAKDHPDWLADKGKIAKNTMPKDWELIDLGKPEVKNWLAALFRKLKRDWGLKVIKIDFIYYALAAEKYGGGETTNLEAYREAHRIIRDEIGGDTFLIEVAVPTYSALGYADGMRLGLDIVPEWQDDEGYLAQGVKPMVRNVARRYYLNHRTWVNHPDMFYLGSPEEKPRWGGKQLTFEEARCYATLVALQGGITKIGDTFTGLDRRQADMLSRLFPVYPHGARPIDLFEMAYPQLWDLPVSAGGQNWHAVGVFNWGRNRQWGKPVPEATTTVTLNGSAIGLEPNAEYISYGFWSDSFFGEFNGAGGLAITLPPRRSEVVAIRKKTGLPQLMSTNRHVTQGGTDLVYEQWNPDTGTLYVTQRLDTGFQYVTTLYAPDGYTVVSAVADGVHITPVQDGHTVRISARASSSGNITWAISFTKK